MPMHASHFAVVTLCAALLALPASAAAPFRNLPGADAPASVATVGGDTCIDYGGWIVTTRPLADEAGTAIYVERSSRLPCGAGPSRARLVFDRGASYFVGRVGRYLVVDQGTGPSFRHLVLFDSTSRRQAFRIGYSELVGAKGNAIHFWAMTRLAAVAANCPSLAEIRRNGLTPVIERLNRLGLDAARPTLRESGTLRCASVQ